MMGRRAWLAIGLGVGAVLLGMLGERTEILFFTRLAGIGFLAAIVVAVSLFWRPQRLPAMPGLFQRPGPGQVWDAERGAPGAPGAPREQRAPKPRKPRKNRP